MFNDYIEELYLDTCNFNQTKEKFLYYYNVKNREIILQGWKIHVSATFENAKEILKIVARFCIENDVSFKFLLDDYVLSESLSKNFDQNESGKFITIYPKSKQDFMALLTELDLLLKGFNGPYIFTDRQYNNNNNLYYRYGVIDSKDGYLISPTGDKIKDIPGPYFYVPDFEKDPFNKDSDGQAVYLNNQVFIDEAPNSVHFLLASLGNSLPR